MTGAWMGPYPTPRLRCFVFRVATELMKSKGIRTTVQHEGVHENGLTFSDAKIYLVRSPSALSDNFAGSGPNGCSAEAVLALVLVMAPGWHSFG